MGFQFSLQTILQYRENEEKQQEARLQQVIAELMSAQDLVEQISAQIQETSSRRGEILAEAFAAFHLQALDSEIDLRRRRQSELKLQVQSLEQKKSEQLREYQHKRTARNILDEMQKQQRQAFDKEQSTQEQKRLDDIFVTRIQRD